MISGIPPFKVSRTNADFGVLPFFALLFHYMMMCVEWMDRNGLYDLDSNNRRVDRNVTEDLCSVLFHNEQRRLIHICHSNNHLGAGGGGGGQGEEAERNSQ